MSLISEGKLITDADDIKKPELKSTKCLWG